MQPRREQAREEGRYAEAEKAFLCAVAKAEEFGPADLRLAGSLANLAGVYREQSRYAEAVSLYRRALAIHGDTAEPRVRMPPHSSITWRSYTLTKALSRGRAPVPPSSGYIRQNPACQA